MNDRYLFKAKRIDNGEWVEGYYLRIGDKTFIICEAEASCMYGDNTDLYATEWYEVQPETICRYTGLTDKNGKRIWENDVVKFPDSEIGTESGYGDCFVNVGKIAYDTESMSYFITNRVTVDMDDIYVREDVEVIGNIFDNPELLEGEKDE